MGVYYGAFVWFCKYVCYLYYVCVAFDNYEHSSRYHNLSHKMLPVLPYFQLWCIN